MVAIRAFHGVNGESEAAQRKAGELLQRAEASPEHLLAYKLLLESGDRLLMLSGLRYMDALVVRHALRLPQEQLAQLSLDLAEYLLQIHGCVELRPKLLHVTLQALFQELL